jgi:peptidyl-prolyl cis-trans isomerase D
MLQTIREKFTGAIAFAIIGLIGLTLVISFGGMGGGVATGTSAAEVNGEEIPMINYQRVMQNQLYRQQQALQGDLTPELQERIQRDALEGMIQNEIVQQFVSDAGFRVADESVMQRIRSEEVFQVGGEYSYESYVMILSNQGIAPEAYERDQRAQMEITQLQNGIVASAFYTPAEYRRYIELLAEERTVALVEFDAEAMAAGVEISDEQLREYYDANNDVFMSEESVSLEYVELRLDDLRQGINVSADDVRAYYDANMERFVAADQRNISHILILVDDDVDDAAAEATAAEVLRRLDGGESFAALAAEFSQDPVSAAQGGDLGWATPGDYPEAFEAALFELEPGQVSAPVRTEFGFHVIQLDELRAGEQQAFADVRDELFDELREQTATDEFYALAERVDDLALENPGDLGAVAGDLGIELRRVDQFTRAGGEPLGYDAALVDAAFSVAVLEDGENSPLIELGDDRAVVVSAVEHRLSALRPFADVRDMVERSLRINGGAELARAQGESLLEKVEGGARFAALATEFDFDEPQPQTLNRASNDVPPEVLAAVFRTPRPADGAPTYRGTALANGGFVVFRLDEVAAGRPESIPQQQRDQRKALLAQQAGGNAAVALITDLRAAAKVIIAPGLFDQPEAL